LGQGRGGASAAVASSARVRGAADRDRVCVGAIAGAHGIQGEVRIKPFTDVAENVAAYGPVFNQNGSRAFDLRIRGVRNGMVIAALDGVADRNEAEGLKGLRLYVAKDALPPPDEDEFYHADLQGGEPVGKVRSIIPAGETEVLEIDRGPGEQRLLVPFTRAAVPEIDVAGGCLTINPPGEVETIETETQDKEIKE
jgi:16S rRNA processing protein RimM